MFFQNSTIKKLAKVIDQENRDKREPKLIHNNEFATPWITFQAKGNRPPLFFLHGDWTGGGFYCGRISEKLGEDQPFYSLPPFKSRKQTVLTMEEMAAHHIAAIQKNVPHGPYLLGGYCIGATVAIEITRQLTEKGEKVNHLLLISPDLSNYRLHRSFWPTVDRIGDILKWDLQRKIHFFDLSVIAFARWLKRSPTHKFASLVRRLGQTRSGIQSSIITGGDEKLSDEEILDSLEYARYVLANRLYKLKPLSVPTTLYFTEKHPPSRRQMHRVRDLFPIVTIETVPGDHRTSIITHTSHLVKKMEKILAHS